MKPRHFFLHILALLACAFCFAACTPEDTIDIFDDDDPETPVTPSDPTDDKNTVTVTSNGALVTHGDISINFPSGTFSQDAKVTVVEEKKGDVLGEDEVSTFYKVTVPPQLDKPLTIKIKCDKQGDDVNVVAHAPCYQLSEDIFTSDNIVLESTYSDGTYTVTIPSTDNHDVESSDRLEISFGVAHLEYCGNRNPSEVKTTRAPVFNEKFTEGNVSWHFKFSPYFKHAYADKLTLHWDEINEVIREAIKKLHSLGLVVTKRDIGMSFSEKLGIPDGAFCQSSFCNEWSTVEFNTRILNNFDANRDKYRRSAIHELMHVFQADYDSRSAYNKAGGLNGKLTGGKYAESDELLLLYESGAVWAEQFMGGSFSNEFAKIYIFSFVKGFDDVNEIYEVDDEATTRHKRYEFHGYGASALIQYITKQMSTYNLNDKSILTLYQIWNNKNYWFSKSAPKDCIKKLTGDKGRDLFSLDHYDDFLLSLAKGELIKGFSVSDMVGSDIGRIKTDVLSVEKSGKCYNYGCQANPFTFLVSDDIPLESKQFVVEQLEDDVQSYLLIYDEATRQYEQIGYKAWKNDPIVISGSDLKRDHYFSESKTTKFSFYILTTTKYNQGSKPHKLRVSLQEVASVTPDSLHYEATGGKQRVKVEPAGHNYFGATVRNEGDGWCGVHAYVEDACYVDITVQPNETGRQRKCIVDCWVTNEASPTEEQMVKMPVRVVQEASGELKVTGINELIFHSELGVKQSDGNETTRRCEIRDTNYPECTITQSGSSVFVSYIYNGSDSEHGDENTLSKALSFEIAGFKGDCANAQVRNIKAKYEYNNYHQYGPYWTHDDVLLRWMWNLSIETLPKTYSSTSFGDNGVRLVFKSNRESGIPITDFSACESWLYDVRHDYDFTYSPQSYDEAQLEVVFRLESTPNTAPRRRSSPHASPWAMKSSTSAAVR